jgi:L-2-hydroxyglutarate oxidase
MISNSFDFIIVGAGIVGLTISFELKKRYPKASILILEKELDLGMHASGRNSGVLHSGVYYGNTTLKAKVCSKGAKLMRDFAAEHKIHCEKLGKIIIATSDNDLPIIKQLLNNAKNNNVNAIHVNEKEIREIEPFASPYKEGIFCPDTSVIDSKSVIFTLKKILKQKGVKFLFSTPILEVFSNQKYISTAKGNFSYGFLYNCAGANADLIAKKFGFAEKYTLIPFKGIYYKIKSAKNYLVRSNIYPVPDIRQPFLGVHLTRVASGDVYIGPTAIPAFGRENYGIIKGIQPSEGIKILRQISLMYFKDKNNFRQLVHSEVRKYLKPFFLASAKKLMNSLKSEDIELSSKVGIRPQLVNTINQELEMDYILEGDDHSMHILNSISPAFTSSFAFAEWIINMTEKNNCS